MNRPVDPVIPIIEGSIVDPVESHIKFREDKYRDGIEPGEKISGLTEVFSKYPGGYEWSAFAVWRDDHRFYWYEDCGCSCYGPGEDIKSLAAMSNGSADDLVRAYKRWAKEDPFLSEDEKTSAVRDIRLAIREARNV